MNEIAEKKIRENIRYSSQWWSKQNAIRAFFSYTEKFHARDVIHHLKKYNVNNKNIMDTGFGAGYLIGKLCNKYADKNCTLIGFDIARENVQNLNKKNISIQKSTSVYGLQIDPYRSFFPVKNTTIDYLICSHVLEHVVDDNLLLNEIYRITSDTSILFIMVPINEEGRDVPTHVRQYTSKSFKHLISDRFTIIHSEENDSFSWLVGDFALKKGLHYNIAKKGLIFFLSFLPHSLVRFLDKIAINLGLKPSQVFFILQKKL